MKELIIYHNGECTKSKGALEILIENQIPHTVRWYIAEPLSKEELLVLLNKLGMPPSQLVRTNEEIYLKEYAGKTLSEDQWLEALIAHPILLQRPIVALGNLAIVARPAEKVLDLIA